MDHDPCHLAQFNIARLSAPLDSPRLKEFVDFLAPVNRLAEESPGSVWRLKDELGQSSTYLPPAYADAMIITNLTVWHLIGAKKRRAAPSPQRAALTLGLVGHGRPVPADRALARDRAEAQPGPATPGRPYHYAAAAITRRYASRAPLHFYNSCSSLGLCSGHAPAASCAAISLRT